MVRHVLLWGSRTFFGLVCGFVAICEGCLVDSALESDRLVTPIGRATMVLTSQVHWAFSGLPGVGGNVDEFPRRCSCILFNVQKVAVFQDSKDDIGIIDTSDGLQFPTALAHERVDLVDFLDQSSPGLA